jgi:UPF0755 protein
MKYQVVRFVLLILLTGAAALGWLIYDIQAFMIQPLPLTERAIFTIEKGKSLRDVSSGLARSGWLTKPYYLTLAGRQSGQATAIKAGEYALIPGMDPRSLLEMFVAGRVVQYPITLPEGWSFRQILKALADNPILRPTLTERSPAGVMRQLGVGEPFLEGLLFPDTYHFLCGTTDIEILRRSYREMKSKLAEEWANRAPDLPYQNEYEALIMASIIEKETGFAEERATIAGVFVRRLERRMKLQTDPTVIYAMDDAYAGDIKRADLTIDSPYNTYLYPGLPPTPIASPGQASIHAALHPEAGDSLYFVAMGSGRHYFSATLTEHNRAVARYQLSRRSGSQEKVQE